MARRSAENLTKHRERIISIAPNLAEVLRGTLRARYVRCGKPGCHCQEGKGHGPFLYLSVTLGGKSVQITIAAKDRAVAKRFLRNYQRLQHMLEKVSKINRELLRHRLLTKPPVKRKVSSSYRRRRKKKRT